MKRYSLLVLILLGSPLYAAQADREVSLNWLLGEPEVGKDPHFIRGVDTENEKKARDFTLDDFYANPDLIVNNMGLPTHDAGLLGNDQENEAGGNGIGAVDIGGMYDMLPEEFRTKVKPLGSIATDIGRWVVNKVVSEEEKGPLIESLDSFDALFKEGDVCKRDPKLFADLLVDAFKGTFTNEEVPRFVVKKYIELNNQILKKVNEKNQGLVEYAALGYISGEATWKLLIELLQRGALAQSSFIDTLKKEIANVVVTTNMSSDDIQRNEEKKIRKHQVLHVCAIASQPGVKLYPQDPLTIPVPQNSWSLWNLLGWK